MPCGDARNATERKSNHSLCGPGIHPDLAAAKEGAGDGPQVVKDKCGK